HDAAVLVAEVLGLPPPFAPLPGVLLLVEAAAHTDPTDELADAVAAAGERVEDVVVATDTPGAQRLWAWREGVAEAVARVGIPHKLDVTLPLSRLAAFADAVPAVAAAAAEGARC